MQTLAPRQPTERPAGALARTLNQAVLYLALIILFLLPTSIWSVIMIALIVEKLGLKAKQSESVGQRDATESKTTSLHSEGE